MYSNDVSLNVFDDNVAVSYKGKTETFSFPNENIARLTIPRILSCIAKSNEESLSRLFDSEKDIFYEIFADENCLPDIEKAIRYALDSLFDERFEIETCDIKNILNVAKKYDLSAKTIEEIVCSMPIYVVSSHFPNDIAQNYSFYTFSNQFKNMKNPKKEIFEDLKNCMLEYINVFYHFEEFFDEKYENNYIKLVSAIKNTKDIEELTSLSYETPDGTILTCKKHNFANMLRSEQKSLLFG